ncbi:MAG: hypothetical protein EBX50_23265, partial [Chitinophagia bacterium]|nr:hypothetical protein [Chitinophagia bacterium]
MEEYSSHPRSLKTTLTTIVVVLIITVIGYGTISVFLFPATTFVAPITITVTKGEPLTALSDDLFQKGLISSKRLFEATLITLGGEHAIAEGEYYFDQPVGILSLATRFSGQQFGITRSKVTFPEGFSRSDMAIRLKQVLPAFDQTTFLTLTKDKEGYLFPDTYHFFPHANAQSVVTLLEETFTTKTASLKEDARSEGKDWSDIVIMASIIEREAGENDREIVSGILWKRLSQGIPLQADATIRYVTRTEGSVTKSELAID